MKKDAMDIQKDILDVIDNTQEVVDEVTESVDVDIISEDDEKEESYTKAELKAMKMAEKLAKKEAKKLNNAKKTDSLDETHAIEEMVSADTTEDKDVLDTTSEIKDNIDIVKRKGLKLTAKLILVVTIILVVMSLASAVISVITMKAKSVDLVENQLKATAYASVVHYSGLSQADFKVSQSGLLYKGSYALQDNVTFINDLAAESEVYSTVYFEDKAYISSIIGADGNMYLDSAVPEDIKAQVYKNQTVFAENININGTSYYGAFSPLVQPSSGDVCGVVFSGIKSSVVSDDLNESIIKITITSVVAILISVIVVVFILRVITKALKKTVSDINNVSQGNLNFEINKKLSNRADEIGDMARSIDTVILNFKTVITKLIGAVGELTEFSGCFSESFERISETITNVNVAVDEIAHGATEQATETMNANDRVINMGDAIGQANSNISLLGDSSKKMKTYSDEASGTLVELSKINDKTKNSVNEVQNQTNLTNKSALAIQEATSLIADISTQTNLLSLNASIEAARAGENGRGFAVVANEIRNLADQSRASAEKITEIVNNLIQNSNESVETMDEVMGVIADQNKKLDDTRRMFDSLNTEIIEVNSAIENIETEIQQLLGIKDSVYASVENLAAIAEENAASTEETAASMTSLTGIVDECLTATNQLVDLAASLDDSIKVFQI